MDGNPLSFRIVEDGENEPQEYEVESHCACEKPDWRLTIDEGMACLQCAACKGSLDGYWQDLPEAIYMDGDIAVDVTVECECIHRRNCDSADCNVSLRITSKGDD